MHLSGFRSFPLNCTVYNPDTKKADHFAVECFLDTSPRWAKYSPPKAGALAHVFGNLLGLFQIDQSRTPALHIADWKNLSTIDRTLAAAELQPALPATTPKWRKMLPPSSSSPTATTPAKRAASPLLRAMNVDGDSDGTSDSDTTAGGFILHDSPVRQTGRQKRPSLKAAEEMEKRKDQSGSS
jgi:hypothetical protein